MAAPGWGFPSAAAWPSCWAVPSSSKATRDGAALSPSLCPSKATGVISKEASESFTSAYQQLQLGAGSGEIDTLLNSLRVASDPADHTKLNIVNEMINDTGDDRNNIQQGDKIVLIVEDDLRFGKIIIDKAHEYDLKAVVATNYIEVFDFVNRFTPIAITLDVKLPDTSGWKVLDLLRNDLNYRHIPDPSHLRRREPGPGPQTRRPQLPAKTARE